MDKAMADLEELIGLADGWAPTHAATGRIGVLGERIAAALAGSGGDGASVRVRREDITPVLVERCAEAAWYARHHLSWDGAYDGSRDSYRQATRVALETAFVALAAAGATGEGGGSDASG